MSPGGQNRVSLDNVREVEIERNENAPFCNACPENSVIGRTCELFLSDGARVVAEADERCMDELR